MGQLKGPLGGYTFPTKDVTLKHHAGAVVRIMQLSSAAVKAYRHGLISETLVDDGQGGVKIARSLVKDVDAQAMLIALSVVDETGARLYTDEDAPLIAAELPQAVIDEVFGAAQELSGLNVKSSEDAEKNSDGAPSASSSSTSRNLSDAPLPSSK